jgi:hypothetical protein
MFIIFFYDIGTWLLYISFYEICFDIFSHATKIICSVVIDWLIDWLIDYCFTFRSRIFHIWKRHHCRWRAAKFRLMLGAQGLRAGEGYLSPVVIRGFGSSGLIRMTAPFSRLLRHARGCWGPIIVVGNTLSWFFNRWNIFALFLMKYSFLSLQIENI